MKKNLRNLILVVNDVGYKLLRPLLFRQSAQEAHERLIALLKKADDSPFACIMAEIIHRLSFRKAPVQIGGVDLPQPFILAAGFVKGTGFKSEIEALEAVRTGENIIAGWKTVPKLLGVVEFGSFTRQPRMGNEGTVLWRDTKTRSTQNRIGLKNAGVHAVAEFLLKHVIDLPQVFGINIAVSPGVSHEQAVSDVKESILAFLKRGVVPNWFTLNVSCPNTEDDPSGNQTESLTRDLCQAALNEISEAGFTTPLWVKISPDLAESQYKILIRLFHDLGVKAVVATNTLGQPSPDNATLQAGVGGGKLYPHALKTAEILQEEKRRFGYAVDVVGCGGVMDRDSYLPYKARGISVVQYWSALIYRGPLAAAIIESELE
jgi:dihydroorotate dehydrogenase